MSEVVKRLRDRRAGVWEDAKKLADRASEENRAFTSEEQSTWNTLNSELDALDRRVKDVIEGEQRAKDTEDAFSRLEGQPVERGQERSAQRQDANVEQMRAFFCGEEGAPRALEVRANPQEVRDLTKLTAAAGLNTVPTSFYGRLVEHLIEVSGIMQAGPTVLNTTSGEVIQIPKTTAHTGNPAVLAEAGTILENDPTFGQVSLGAFKYPRMVQLSSELLSDSGVDMEGYIAKSVGRALGNSFGADLVTGAGTTVPRGVIIDAGAGSTGPTGTSTTFGTQSTAGQGFDLLIALYHSVISPYRASKSCAWLMNDTTASKVRMLKDSTGAYVWQPAVTLGAPDMILGKPVYIDPNVASPGANAESIAFGDWSTYFVRLAGGIRFERSDDFAFGNDLVSFRAILRGDGALTDLTGSIKTFTHSAT